MINGSPQVMSLDIDLYEHLIDMPAPLAKALHTADPLPLDVGCEYRTEPIPP